MLNLQQLIRWSHLLFFIEPLRPSLTHLLIDLINISLALDQFDPAEVILPEGCVVYIAPVFFTKLNPCSPQIVSQILVLIECIIVYKLDTFNHSHRSVPQESISYIYTALLGKLICQSDIYESLVDDIILDLVRSIGITHDGFDHLTNILLY